jgi:glutathione peroxidase
VLSRQVLQEIFMADIYDFAAKTIDGEEVAFNTYRGRPLLIVNTASKCGFTPQYAGLEALQQKYGAEGFSVLAFPCDQFGHQEPGDAEEIKNFCTTKYDVTFPVFAKIEVNGANAHPLWAFLKKEKTGLLGGAIKWNFTKFLISPEGDVLERFPPTTKPEAIGPKVEKLLHRG